MSPSASRPAHSHTEMLYSHGTQPGVQTELLSTCPDPLILSARTCKASSPEELLVRTSYFSLFLCVSLTDGSAPTLFPVFEPSGPVPVSEQGPPACPQFPSDSSQEHTQQPQKMLLNLEAAF